MANVPLRTKGFTLIASLLLLLLLSGIAIGLMMMVNTEGKVGGTDLQNNIAFHAAEGGIEKMTSDLASTFQNAQSPTAAQVCNLSNNVPTMAGITWKDYTVTPGQIGQACPASLAGVAQFGQISAGPNQGLYAQIIPINLLATAQTWGGQEVSMTRSAQVALIPVFQFGIFSEGDLSFFSGPNFDFAGRVHTNGDLYPEVGPGSTLTFHDKIAAYGNVVRANLANGYPTSTNYNGTVLIPTAAQGCDGTKPNCRALALTEGSVTGAGGNPPQSSQNSNWPTLSLSTYNGEIIDGNYGNSGGTGAKKLSMPFVNGTTCPGTTLACPYQIIRRPAAGELPTSPIGTSREYNMAQIHVLLSDNPSQLPSGSVRLANVTGSGGSNPYGIAVSSAVNGYATTTTLPTLGSGNTYNLYFAAASNAIPDVTPCTATGATPQCPTASTFSTLAPDWPYGPATPPSGAATLTPSGAPIITGTGGSGVTVPTISLCPYAPYNNSSSSSSWPSGCPTASAPQYPFYPVPTPTATWNLIDGYLYVEYQDSSGNWHNVTNEWLGLGFARGLVPPTASSAGTPTTGTQNPINPQAILLLQEPADRRGNGVVNLPDDHQGSPPTCTALQSSTAAGPSSTNKCTAWTNPLPPEFLADSLMPSAPASASISPWFGVTNSSGSVSTTAQSETMYNWYPINFYDVREGEVRDNATGDQSCTANGVMNAVEIDVGNLKQWLAGNIGTSGTSVNYGTQNGYVLYFSDRRGMLPNPNWGNAISGDAGLEDDINRSSAAGTPDHVLEPIPSGASISPEDVNENGYLDNFGAQNMGLGFYNGTSNLNAAIAPALDPYTTRITTCSTTGRKNWVSGARHVLRLVDGSLGNVPLIMAGANANTGGFTLASENPVYIMGDYNSNSTDTTWNSTPTDTTGHSAASVIADAVTLLSDNWVTGTTANSGDLNSFNGPTSYASRVAATSYYRLAIAGGKNINFPQPTWTGVANDFGTDGGTHNFLRYIENWGGQTLNYKGSIVSMYYATYGTGIYKCCNIVYSPPTRNYSFDSDFTVPSGLPPGTPLFRDVDSLGYRQLFTTRSY